MRTKGYIKKSYEDTPLISIITVVFNGEKYLEETIQSVINQSYDDASLVTLYGAVDVMVMPSLQENLSNAIIESLAFGTPVTGFNIGGNSDLIDHKINGYLAKPFKSRDLADGIEWVLNAPNYDELCQNAREKVLEEFDSKVVARKYMKLYEEILQK